MISGILAGLFRRSHPGYLVFFVTSRCNCRCDMCFNRENVHKGPESGIDGKNGGSGELTTDQIEVIARSMKVLPQVLLSGGEPFMRRDIARIVESFYIHAGTRQVSIPTNATLTGHVSGEVAKMVAACKEAYININISLDGIGEDQDESRGLAGCYERLCETYVELDKIRERHNRLSINFLTTVKNSNAGKISEIVEHVKKTFKANYHFLSTVRGNVKEELKEYDTRRVEEELSDLYKNNRTAFELPVLNRFGPAVARMIWKILRETRKSRKRNFTCLAGKKMVVITPEGNLMPCEPLWLEPDVRRHEDVNHFMMARLEEHEFDVTEALKSRKAREIKRFIARKICSCEYGCAVYNSIIYCPNMYPEILMEMLKKK